MNTFLVFLMVCFLFFHFNDNSFVGDRAKSNPWKTDDRGKAKKPHAGLRVLSREHVNYELTRGKPVKPDKEMPQNLFDKTRYLLPLTFK